LALLLLEAVLILLDGKNDNDVFDGTELYGFSELFFVVVLNNGEGK
jgi:hypothetical protein